MRGSSLAVLVPLLAVASTAAALPPATEPHTEAWERVLGAYVIDGGVDYAALQQDRSDLDAFLASLAEADPGEWSSAGRLAFWINAYNAVVVAFVLERYPELTSVREVDGFFDRRRFPVAGRERTLDEIERSARDLEEPRVHFALVCASTSCPDLRGEAYRGERLDEQLAEQTAAFLADPEKGLRLDERSGVLHLSPIFKWYAGEFTGGSAVLSYFFRGGIVDWVAAHVPPQLRSRIEATDPKVSYMDYDWSLNDR